MTTSDPASQSTGRRQLYVWIWLPGTHQPVVAGSVTDSGNVLDGHPVLVFTYARSYRARPDAISLFPSELPLAPGTFDPTRPSPGRSPLPLHSCIRDSAPDAWGRRVLNVRLGGDSDVELTELTYLAGSGSDRIGALDFQVSASRYVPRGDVATLEQLLRAAELIDAGLPLPDELVAAAGHGTSIGGAQPKALLQDGRRHLIAKFSSSTDTRPVIKAEAAATILAGHVGIEVPKVEVRRVDGKDVLILERFDRDSAGGRRLMLSALTILGRHEHEARYSTYADIADAIRTGPWDDVPGTLREMFTRLVFNICIGNTDDHLRNHAAFWNGSTLRLTPAYDLSPQSRSTSVATQAIGVTRAGERHSQLRLCRTAARDFLLAPGDAEQIMTGVVSTIRGHWADACEMARLTRLEAATLMGREILNDYIFYESA